jgi:hypothetical protein
MKSFKKISALMLALGVGFGLIGCSHTRPKADEWRLPIKESAESGLIMGRIDFPDNKDENPNGDKVYLSKVEFWPDDDGRGIAIDNNYFVLPNIKPGQYYLSTFKTGKINNVIPRFDENYKIEVMPGQIVYFGSYDYLSISDKTFFRWGRSGLRKAENPSELDMLRWLYRRSIGTGWEQSIEARIKEVEIKK